MDKPQLVQVIDDALGEALEYPAIGVQYQDGTALAELIADRIIEYGNEANENRSQT
jgi:hypothetical protein